MDFYLSSKEFIFLCYAAGGTQMYGIEDAFKQVNTSDISSEIRKVHNSLEEKKYIESDFDGNTTIDKQLLKTIQSCVNCSKFVFFNCSKENYTKTVNFYFNKNLSVTAVKNGDNYILGQFDEKSFSDLMLSNLSLQNGDEFNEFFEATVLQKELAQIKKDLRSSEKTEAVDKLNLKFGKTISSKLISALEEKEDFYSIAVIDNENSQCSFNSIMIIDTNKGALLLKNSVVELENAVTITACTRKEIISLVKSLICSVTD